MNTVVKNIYRKDIDGLRAISIISVILFHFGFLKNGYLGVDVFFVISGFLITKIAYKQAVDNNFSIIDFYLRRIRRIIPLVLFSVFITLIIGIFVMLPDDLENLSQSIIATNLFANNILMFLTTSDYWAIANELKPMMHTWSLGIEEQFYMLFPLIFLFFSGKKSRFILPILFVLTLISIFLFFYETKEASKFYLIQYRFFELSIGGLGAILCLNKFVSFKFRFLFVLLILLILGIDSSINSSINLFLIVLATLGVLITYNGKPLMVLKLSLLENNFMVWIGKISFSLYIWHQIVLAYSRYFVFEAETISSKQYIFMSIIILLLSILSFNYIEQLFRDSKRVKTKNLLIISSIFFLLTTLSSFYIYYSRGILRDVPELELLRANKEINQHNRNSNLYIQYNERINDYDKNFENNNKINILVIGNSFARDFSNILLESNFSNKIQISYIKDLENCSNFKGRSDKANFIFFSNIEKNEYYKFASKFNINDEKVWCVGTKRFTGKNGYFYNHNNIKTGCNIRTNIDTLIFNQNIKLKNQWGGKYIDLIEVLIDKNKTIPVYTNDCMFISPDGLHLTHAGAEYFSQKLNLREILKIN